MKLLVSLKERFVRNVIKRKGVLHNVMSLKLKKIGVIFKVISGFVSQVGWH